MFLIPVVLQLHIFVNKYLKKFKLFNQILEKKLLCKTKCFSIAQLLSICMCYLCLFDIDRCLNNDLAKVGYVTAWNWGSRTNIDLI